MCTLSACFDGGWGSWSNWSSCSETCGGGTRLKTRTCTNPKPSLEAKQCEGLNFQVSLCNKQTCPENKISFTAYGISGTGSPTFRFPHTYQYIDWKVYMCGAWNLLLFVEISKKHYDNSPVDYVLCYMYFKFSS
ncbi:ectin-like [Mercenaria mercenaria]|uniref:ectin-like n=1 Tax=Mercenaria mercenaria TaxID=6596 RepID=UPI00234FABB3|nr:ectin-like [Mercenaria mercenaria]